jgi:hypothetical protein
MQHYLSPRTQWLRRALACAYAGEFLSLQAGLRGLPSDLRFNLARELEAKLARHARCTGDWTTWAETLHYLPHPGRAEAGRELGDRLMAWAASPKPNTRWRQLARLAMQRLRGGATARELMAALNDANATLAEPLSGPEIDTVINWAIREFCGDVAHG